MSVLNAAKHWLRDLVRYPPYRPTDASYDEYWSHRDMEAPLNDYQRYRVEYIGSHLSSHDSVLDVGCGDGRILAELLRCMPDLAVRGIDSSADALEHARRRGLEVERADISDPGALVAERVDWVLILEVIEHMPNSEELLAWAMAHAQKGVVFSVPNTGFIAHRMRLLMGRFPLQWRAHPAEHVRFWTLRDMRWWLASLGYHYELHAYEGVPGLNRIWPSLFAAGVIVRILPRA